jgi:Cupin domain
MTSRETTRVIARQDGEPPRDVRRLQFLGRLESCQVVRREGIRRSCVSARCGWSPRSAISTGTPVFVQRHDEGIWAEAAAWSERILDETFGSGYVRTLVLRLVRSPREPAVIRPHAPGTLHHLYVISGRLRTGPVNDPVELGAGDFVRFPGDIEHRHVCLSERVAAHMVTTVPQVRQFGPTVIRGGARCEEPRWR